jgi:hypothetical protein
MSGVHQAVFMNQRSFGLALGDAYEGGFYAGQISTAGNGVASHNIVVAPLSSGQTTAQWKISNSSAPGSTSDIDGPQNTADIVSGGSSAIYPAAHFCNDAVIGGFSDWYMAAKNELEVCYFNLKPTTTSNNVFSGANPNAVPSRLSNYTSGDPAQTSAAAFQSGGAEAFTASNYWSSTQFGGYAARAQNFSTGYQASSYSLKRNYNLVRAIRRVAV